MVSVVDHTLRELHGGVDGAVNGGPRGRVLSYRGDISASQALMRMTEVSAWMAYFGMRFARRGLPECPNHPRASPLLPSRNQHRGA